MVKQNIFDIQTKNLLKQLNLLYDENKALKIYNEILDLIMKYKPEIKQINNNSTFLTEKDVVIITYADQITENGKYPLVTLTDFFNTYFKGLINFIHILPFYPYSSDDGFSVIDYYEVKQEYGNWEHINILSSSFNLMFDAVINHISAQSNWFKEYLSGNKLYSDYFIEADPQKNYSCVTRPRALPLLTKFNTANGIKYLWTTFSEDQIDINYKSERLLLNIVDLLLFYISNNAKLIRLDAIGYLWKEENTSCINLPQTHTMIKLFRSIIELTGSDTKLITETNVPHQDNISYFGSGYDEAHMVYAFSLPPLTLFAFLTENSYPLMEWLKILELQSEQTTFFNFLASHDGIGVMPAKGYLKDDELDFMIKKVTEKGGYVSYKNNPDGTKSPYELNINYYEAIADNNVDENINIKKFIAAQSLLLSLRGVPGIYIHSILGSKNYSEGVLKTGQNRTINREKLIKNNLDQELKDINSLRSKIFSQFKYLIVTRKKEVAFSPESNQKIIFNNKSLISFLRMDKSKNNCILCLVNVSNKQNTFAIDLEEFELTNKSRCKDLISGNMIHIENNRINLNMDTYQVMWLKFIV